jgi:hypothetical protein
MMKAVDLIHDPIFQLNLLVWAATEQPEGEAAVVTPLFSRSGYKLAYIENPFPFPVSVQQQLKNIEDIGKAPNADVIVANSDRQSAFYIEAKKDSFGTESSSCRQARAHLIAAGPVFAEVYAPIKECRLIYALPEKCRSLMEPTLRSLSTDVAGRGFKPGLFSIHGFDVGEKFVTYTLDDPSAAALGESGKVIPLLPIPDDGETDPSPLLLIYTDCDTFNQTDRGLYRRILIDKIYAQLLCQLQHCNPITTFVLKPEEVLMKTSGGAFEFVGGDTRKRMRVLVRDNIYKRIVKFWGEKNAKVFQLKGFELTVSFGDDYNKEQFLEWFEDHARTKISDAPADPREIEQTEFLLETPEEKKPPAS